MKKLTATALLAAGLLSAATLQVTAQAPPPAAEKATPPKSEDPPGYKDFEDGDLSPRDVEDLEDRRDDRNVVSPGTRDEQELDSEMGVDR